MTIVTRPLARRAAAPPQTETYPTVDDSIKVSAVCGDASEAPEPVAHTAGATKVAGGPPAEILPAKEPMWSHKRRTERSVPVVVLSW